MRIANDCVARFHYTLTGEDGEVIDSSAGGPPLAYLHGHGQIIPGLEAALAGRKAGETFRAEIAPEDAYGAHDPARIEQVPLEAFQGVERVEPGMMFQAQTPEGMQVVRVVAVEDGVVTIDGNHPLAGQTLRFEIEVVDVRPATEDELAHGHVHEDGSCA